MLMTAPSGGGGGSGRDVIFNLKVVADGKAMSDLTRFGKEVEKIQKGMEETAIQSIRREQREKQKAMEGTAAWYAKVRQKSAELEQKAGLTAIQQAKKAEADKLAWMEGVRRRSLQMEQRDKLRSIEETRRAESRAAQAKEKELIRLAGIEKSARAQALTSRFASREGFTLAGRGAIGLARGAALGGMLGEKDSEKMLQTLLAIEASFQTLNAGLDIWKGLTLGVNEYRKAVEAAKAAQAALGAAQAAGGAASAGGSAAATGVAGGGMTGPAAIAAIIGVGLAVRGLAEVIRNASRTDYGGPNDRQTTTGGSILGMFGKGSRRNVARGLDAVASLTPLGFFGGGGYTAEADQMDSRDRLDRQMKTNSEMMAMASRRGAGALEASRVIREQKYTSNRERFAFGPGSDLQKSISTNAADLQSARELLHIARERAAEAEQGRGNLQASIQMELEAQMEMKRLIGERYELEKRVSEEGVRGAKEKLSLAKQEAAEAQGRLKSDKEKFGDMSPAEQARIKEIDRKRDAGISLTSEESQLARGFAEFRDFAGESSLARADLAGAGDIFTEGIAAVAKAELNVKTKQDVVVKVEADTKRLEEVLEMFKGAAQSVLEQQRYVREKIQPIVQMEISKILQSRK